VRAHCLIHYFAGGAVDAAGPTALTPAQSAAVQPPPADGPAVLLDSDQPLVAALARDGRTGLPELATATGWSESTVRRRLEHLLRTGAIFFDVEVDPVLFGYTARVLLWMSVAPAHLETVGRALCTHPEVVFAAATTGATNLVATVICPDMAGLYEYLTHRIGPLPGVERVETAPALRHVKQVGAVF
jgi:DNA-binding Lrp family transcriptional regulator